MQSDGKIVLIGIYGIGKVYPCLPLHAVGYHTAADGSVTTGI